jgi:uncharacterized protein (DUF1778 family)
VITNGFIASLQRTIMTDTISKGRIPQRRAAADTTITLRVPNQTRSVIDVAAAAIGKTRTEFMLDCARNQAIDILLDQVVFDLDEQASGALADIFVNPAVPLPALRALMTAKVPWE